MHQCLHPKATDPEVIMRYFDLLEVLLLFSLQLGFWPSKAIKENELCGQPGQIFNMDKPGMQLDPKPPKLACEMGGRACAISSGDK